MGNHFLTLNQSKKNLGCQPGPLANLYLTIECPIVFHHKHCPAILFTKEGAGWNL
jgi:hypothetical protein